MWSVRLWKAVRSHNLDLTISHVCVGVTIVQYRDKTSETADLIRTGKQLHKITKEHRIPLLINDRVDVALAVGAEGVHIGQDDMGTLPISCTVRPVSGILIEDSKSLKCQQGRVYNSYTLTSC